MSRISLCLIARDEARFLPGCLASLTGAVDEIVVVDTGSVDATAAIAAEAGARVVTHPWADDFAAARNAALAEATGDWILILDADERLAPGAGAALRAAVARADFDCGLLPLHNAESLDSAPAAVLSGAARIGEATLLPRLLRRDPELRWWGAIHESVGPWVVAGRRVAQVDVPIVHLGAVPELRDERSKGARNRALLERHCMRQPDDAWARSYLAWELLDAGDLARATRQAARAWTDALAQRDGGDALGKARDLTQAATLRAFTLLQAGDADTALAVLDEAVARGVAHPNMAVLRAAALDAQAEVSPSVLAAALDEVDAARRLHGRMFATTPIPGATSWLAAASSGALALRLGRLDAAARAVDAAWAENPESDVVALTRGEVVLARGQAEAALGAVEPLLERDSPDAWTVAAGAALALGQANLARDFARKARDGEKNGWVAARRQADLARLEDTIDAARTLATLLGGPPPKAPDAAAAAAQAAAKHAAGDPGGAVAAAAGALAARPGDAATWAVLGASLRAAGLGPQAERALRTAVRLDPAEATARRLLAATATSGAEAARHLRLAAHSERALGELGVHHPAAPRDCDVTVLTAADAPEALVGFLDALSFQDRGGFEVRVIGPAALDPVVAAPRPFPLARHDDLPAALAAADGALTLLLDVHRVAPPGLVSGHAATQAANPGLVLGGAGAAPLDGPTEMGTILADPALAAPHASDRAGRPGHASLPTAALRAAAPAAWAAGVLLGVDLPVVLADALRAPWTDAIGLSDLRERAQAAGRAEATRAERLRTVEAIEAELQRRARAEAEAARTRRRVAALQRSDQRRGAPTGAALTNRVAALESVLAQDRGRARAVAAAPHPLPDPPLTDRLTSVVMLNLNGKGHLYGAVESLRAHTTGPVELIVVDNGSTDESLDWLRAQDDIVVLEMGENIGAPAGRNRGLEVARGDTILFCDNDVVFTPRWRELLISHLEAWPDIGAVGPMSDVVTGSQLVSEPPPPGGDLAAWAERFTAAHSGESLWTLRLILFCMMFRREAVEDIGGIDPRYGRWGFEDDDLSLRLARAGWHQRVAADCFIQHLGSRTSKSANIDYQALLVQNWGRFKARWGLDPDLPYGSPIPLDAVLAADWDRELDYVPFRRPGWTAPEGPLTLLRWGR